MTEKLLRTHNKRVGLIAFASPDKSFITPTSITIVFTHLLYFLYREQSCIRDKVYGAVGRRAVVMVFASPSANFCTRSNSRRLSGLSHLDNFIWTGKLSSVYRDFAKTHANPDTDGNFPYHRAVRVALPPVFINCSNELLAVTLVFWLAENK